MKRILGFAIGTALGVGTVYVVRRWLIGNQAGQPQALAPTVPAPVVSQPEPAAKPGRFTVRTNGPRPQPPASLNTEAADGATPTSSKVGGEIEPVAAQETTPSAASSRAEIEATQELALAEPEVKAPAQEVLPEVEPAPATIQEPTQAANSEAAESESEKSENSSTQDDLARIRGIGEATAQKLYAADITTFAQLAAMSIDQLEEITGFGEGRIQRDKLVEQAAALSRGEVLEFELEAEG